MHMPKLIITHLNPDLDAICSVWLLQKFDKDLASASVVFVPAGETYQGQPADSDPNIIHVDTGHGEFDHHQTSEYICAAELVFNKLKSKFKHLEKDEALLRLIKVVKEVDHFKNCFWKNATVDYFEFFIEEILSGLKVVGKADDNRVIELGTLMLDGTYQSLKIKVEAEEEIEKGREFETKWGKAVACETGNGEVEKLGLRMGYKITVRKDDGLGLLRIKARPEEEIDLTRIAEKIGKMDPGASWFLHPSKRMFFNGSTKNPRFRKTKLQLNEVIEIMKIQNLK